MRAVHLGVLGVLAAGPALAAGGEGPSQSELVWQAVNLAILLGVIVFAARKPVIRFFSERREEIQGDLDHASDLLKEAETRYAEWQRKLVDLEQELEEVRSLSRQRAVAEREAILAEARAAADRIREDASAAVQQELRRAQSELRAEAADLAVELAGDILRRGVAADDRERLVADFIEQVEDSAGGGSA